MVVLKHACRSDSVKRKQEEVEESVFQKKLKVMLKEKGREGRVEFLKDYLDYLLKGNKFLPPDFPTFAREVMGADDRGGFIHLRVWSDNCELVAFAREKGYRYKVDYHD